MRVVSFYWLDKATLTGKCHDTWSACTTLTSRSCSFSAGGEGGMGWGWGGGGEGGWKEGDERGEGFEGRG